MKQYNLQTPLYIYKGVCFFVNNDRPNDRVSGYSLSELEDALPSSLGSWWTWRTKIREKYNNSTEGTELDYLFREYR